MTLDHSTRGRRRLLAALPLAAGLAVVGSAHSASTTFRGRNGRLLSQAQVGANAQLFTINADGTGLRQVTHFKVSGGTNAGWSADGSKIVFTRPWNPDKPNEKIVLY